jgi:hypothetical protein
MVHSAAAGWDTRHPDAARQGRCDAVNRFEPILAAQLPAEMVAVDFTCWRVKIWSVSPGEERPHVRDRGLINPLRALADKQQSSVEEIVEELVDEYLREQ